MLYNSCEVTAKVGKGDNITLKEETHYPFDDEINITVTVARAAKFPLYLRIPSWCSNAEVYINNQLVQHRHIPATYTRIEKHGIIKML